MQRKDPNSKNVSQFEQFTELTLSFLREEWPIHPVPDSAKLESFWCVYADEQAALINKLLHEVDKRRLPFVIRQLDIAFRDTQRDQHASSLRARKTLLQWTLAGQTHRNWKDALYGSLVVDQQFCSIGHRPIEHSAQYIAQKGYANDDSFPMVHFVLAPNSHFQDCRAVVLGSTFHTNEQVILETIYPEQSDQQSHMAPEYPEATNSGYIIDQNQHCSGLVFALAHSDAQPSSSRQKLHNLSQTCNTAVEHGVRLLSQPYNDPEYFKNDLPSMMRQDLQEMLHVQTANSGERIELLAARSFLLDENHQRLIGINIGQSILFGWHPVEKKITLISSSRIEQNDNKPVPLLIPSESAQGIPSIRLFDVTVPVGTIFIPISHGFQAHLQQKKTTLHHGVRAFIEHAFDPNELRELLYDSSTPSSCVEKLARHTFSRHLETLSTTTRFANEAEQRHSELVKYKEQRVTEIFSEYDRLSQTEAHLDNRIVENNHLCTNEHKAERSQLSSAREALKIELNNLERDIEKLDQTRHFSVGENGGILAIQMPSQALCLPQTELKKQDKTPPSHPLIKKTHSALLQALEENFDPSGKNSLYQFFFHPRCNTVNRLRRLNKSKPHTPSDLVCFTSLSSYYNYLYAEQAAIRDKGSSVYRAIDIALAGIRAQNPEIDWLRQDQRVDESSFSILCDPKTNRQIAINLLTFSDKLERSWQNFNINAWHHMRPFHPNNNQRPHHHHGLSSIVQAAGSLAVKISLCKCPSDYQYWVGSAGSIIESLFEGDHAHEDFCQLLVEQIAMVEKLLNPPSLHTPRQTNEALAVELPTVGKKTH